MKNLLAELSAQLTNLSEDEKFSLFVSSGITAINYIREQFYTLYRQRSYHSFENNKNCSARSHSFFAASAKRLPSESTNQAVLSNLMQDLAKKINEIKLEDHSIEALNIFIKNVTAQLMLFKTSMHSNHSSPASQDFIFLSNFRENKTYLVNKAEVDLNNQLNCA